MILAAESGGCKLICNVGTIKAKARIPVVLAGLQLCFAEWQQIEYPVTRVFEHADSPGEGHDFAASNGGGSPFPALQPTSQAVSQILRRQRVAESNINNLDTVFPAQCPLAPDPLPGILEYRSSTKCLEWAIVLLALVFDREQEIRKVHVKS